jgi:tape measure domain-containing protein
MAALTFKVGGDTTGLGRAVSRAKGMLSGLGSSVKNLGVGSAFTGAVAGAAGAFKSLTVAAEAERSAIAFEAMLGSAKGSAEMMQYLADESKRTGVGVGVMEQNIKRLIANGMGAEDAKELTRSLLDVSGTLGMSSAEAGLLGSALAQVKAKGVASMEELRQQIAERGVPIFEVLSQKIGVTTGELIKMVSEGKVSADTVIDAFKNLEGPLAKFRGGADKMAGTASGAFARMKAELVDLLKRAGGPFLKVIAGSFDKIREITKESGDWLVSVAENVAGALEMVIEMFRQGKLGTFLKDSLMIAGKELVNFLANAFLGLGRMIGEGVKGYVEMIKTGFQALFDPNVWAGLKTALVGIAMAMGAAFLGMLPRALRPGTSMEEVEEKKRRAGTMVEAGVLQILKSEGVRKYGEVFSEIGEAMKSAFMDQIGSGRDVLSTEKERARREKILADIDAARLAKETAKKEEAVKASVAPVIKKEEEKKEGPMESVLKPILTSMGRMAGAGEGFAGGKSERGLSRERNGYLKTIAYNTKTMTARYA